MGPGSKSQKNPKSRIAEKLRNNWYISLFRRELGEVVVAPVLSWSGPKDVAGLSFLIADLQMIRRMYCVSFCYWYLYLVEVSSGLRIFTSFLRWDGDR